MKPAEVPARADYYGDDLARKPQERWHIGREIPLALIFVVILQTAGGVWWASRMATQLEALTKQLDQFTGERYTKDDARRDRELFVQMFKNTETLITQFDRRVQVLELQHDQMRNGQNARRN